MNVFMLLIVFIFMAGWYLMDSPSQNITRHGIEYAQRKTDLNSVLTCIAHVHSEAVALDDELKIEERVDIDNDTPCAENYELSTVKICADGSRISAACIPERANRSVNNFIITSAPARGEDAGKILELLAEEFPSSSGFGILTVEGRALMLILGNGTKREIPPAVAREAGLSDGMPAFVTQYAVAGKPAFASGAVAESVNCRQGEIKVFRFNRWQCAQSGAVTVCGGATMWDAMMQSCVPDNSRRPLCGAQQTAVMIDDNWECVDPTMHKNCPAGQSPHLNYETMEWMCSINPAESKDSSKCDSAMRLRVGAGGVLRPAVASNCNDCETMVTDPETCESACVPDRTKLTGRQCYRGECGGGRRAFYFGFPNAAYIAAARAALPELNSVEIIMGPLHSQNRKFNCMDCGDGYIDSENSVSPWTAVCRSQSMAD